MKMSTLGILVVFMTLGSAGPLLAEYDQQLEGVELQAMADTFQYALENNPTNESSDWVNPDTTRSGAVVPTRTFENAKGQPCREFVTTIIIADQEEQGYGTACRQPDGNWALVADPDQRVTTIPPVSTRSYITQPPIAYYAYPYGFFGSSNIYLSFDYVLRGSRLHRGHLYLSGRSFRDRYPRHVRSRVYLGPRINFRYRLHEELNYRDWDRHNNRKLAKRRNSSKKSGSGWSEKRRDEREYEKRKSGGFRK